MAKPRCDKHKRSLPYCDACKAAVREAEEQAVREEQSAALEAEVGFPNLGESDPGGTPEGHGPGDERAGEEEEEEVVQKEVPETGEPVEGDKTLPVGGMFLPEEPADWDKDIDQAEKDMGESGKHPDPGDEFVTVQVTREVKRLIETIEHSIANGESVTVVMGDAETRLRQEGRKDVIRMVREYYADSIDTNAFQLLAYLEKAC
ncbi:hypothetical protein LCGC14_2103080, partial [marine sediment metagenome]